MKKTIQALVMAAALIGAMAPAQAGNTCQLFGFCPPSNGGGGGGGHNPPSSVPEPAALALLGAGALAVFAVRRRKNSK